MTRVIVWKELREQGTVVAALLVLGCGLIAGLAVVVDPQRASGGMGLFTGVGTVGVALLTVAAGAVVGATLFAGEREAGTFPFLDRMPVTRWQLWWRKVAVGLGLTAVPAGGYFAASTLTGLIEEPGAVAALVFGGATLFGFVWSAVGSVLRRTALGACAVGLSLGVAVTTLAAAVGPIAMAVAGELLSPEWRGSTLAALIEVGSVLVLAFMALAFPLVLSAAIFTASDRQRGVSGSAGAVVPSGTAFRRGKRFAWLLVRQHRVNALWLTAAAGVAGCLMLIPDVLFIAAWPALTLVVGVLVGVTLFADEQGTESARFWGERRLRVGGVWGAKLAFGSALTLGLVVLMALLYVLVTIAQYGTGREILEHRYSTAMIAPGFPHVAFAFVGPAYGLAFGQLAALLFRKPIVALAVGGMVGGAAVALWFPSLFGGGLHGWQVWAPVAVTLVVSRLLTWPWATDTLTQRGPMLRLAGGLVVVALTFAAGIAWRVLEVPVVAEANDDIEFAKSLPSFDENGSGRDIRRAVADFGARAAPHVLTRTDYSTYERPLVMNELYGMLLQSGYPENRPDVDGILKVLDGGEWERSLLDASRKPTGVYYDPTALTTDGDEYTAFQSYQRMVTVYSLRGLLAQREGNPAEYAGRVAVLLAVVRTTRTSGPSTAVSYANALEEATFRGVQHWLRALRGRPDLLRQVLTALLDHDRLDTYTPRRTELASQVVLRNAIAAPGRWLPEQSGIKSDRSQAEADAIGFAWAVPWERERLRRAVGFNNRPEVASASEANPYLLGAPGIWQFEFRRAYLRRFAVKEQRLASFRGCVLQVAVRLHEAEAGRFPATLGELVPKSLPAVPLDPFAAAPTPFGYRVPVAAESIAVEPEEFLVTPDLGPLAPAFAAAAGGLCLIPAVGALLELDVLAVPPADTRRRVTREVVAGQPILWSVGPDRIDDGGRVSLSGNLPRGSVLSGDIVFVVPLQAKAKRP